MKTSLNSSTIAVIFAASAAVSTASEGNSLEQCFPDDIPSITDGSNEYEFSRMKYNSRCNDRNGYQYDWGMVDGVWPPIDDPDGGCGKVCISGYGQAQAKGCSTMPDPTKLVGFNYDCDKATCYCLYTKGTLKYSDHDKCFDKMNNNYNGVGEVEGTSVKQGTTCYSMQYQLVGPRRPAGASICVRSPDYDCYKTGRPACCDSDYTCPSYMTMCDNTPSDFSGGSVCSYAPDYQRYKTGWPDCCSQPGGDVINCPRQDQAGSEDAFSNIAKKVVNFLRGN